MKERPLFLFNGNPLCGMDGVKKTHASSDPTVLIIKTIYPDSYSKTGMAYFASTSSMH